MTGTQSTAQNSHMVAERWFNGVVQDDLDWLDKNRVTESDEFIDDFEPQIQVQAVEVFKTIGAIDATVGGTLATDILSISDTSLRQLNSDQERAQQRSLKQIVDAPVPPVADETVECAVGFEWPASGGAVCLRTDSTTATPTLPTYSGVMDDPLAVGPSFGCSASHKIANTLDTWICHATSIGDSCAVEGTPVEVPQECISEYITEQIIDLQSEASSDANADENPFADVKELITDLTTDLINILQSETSHIPYSDDEFMKASASKEDLETHVETHSFERETAISKSDVMDGGVAELHVDLGDLSQQLKMNAMRVDELEGVVNTMMTDVCQAAGGDMRRGMSSGGFDDAPDAAGNVHDVVMVSAGLVQGTSLLDVTLLSEVIGVSRSTRQPHRSQQRHQQQAVQREEDEKEEAKRQGEREEDRRGEKGRERCEEGERGGSKVVEVETGWVTVKRRERRRQQGRDETTAKPDGRGCSGRSRFSSMWVGPRCFRWRCH